MSLDHPFREPGYWMNETTGILEPVISAYLKRETLTAEQIAIMRQYLVQWIEADVWLGPEIDELRRLAAAIDSNQAIDYWILKALAADIDPL